MSGMIEEYLNYQSKYEKLYGEKTVVLYQNRLSEPPNCHVYGGALLHDSCGEFGIR